MSEQLPTAWWPQACVYIPPPGCLCRPRMGSGNRPCVNIYTESRAGLRSAPGLRCGHGVPGAPKCTPQSAGCSPRRERSAGTVHFIRVLFVFHLHVICVGLAVLGEAERKALPLHTDAKAQDLHPLGRNWAFTKLLLCTKSGAEPTREALLSPFCS